MISLENIFFQYPDAVFKLSIDHLNFDIGSKTAIIGTSGYGKTTMLNIIAGIENSASGNVLINQKHPRFAKIGFVFQNYNLLNRRDIIDNIALPLVYRSIAKKERQTKARILLEKLYAR